MDSTYSYVNKRGQKFYLNTKEITLRGSGHNQRIFWFSKEETEYSTVLPQGYEVVESRRNNLPLLKRIS